MLALSTALVLAFGGTAATTAERIVIYGADTGSNLELSVHGDALVVDGYMSSERPSGCRWERPRHLAVCPLADAGAVEMRMGRSGDMVEVVDPLPFPLTIYLGDGSDKFIGNDEPDTCYSEGARRNRCIGRGGDDICITGQRNSDCEGGAGNDYCKHGAGSDGCWGGPGRDVCVMGSGMDGCHGEGGRDKLYGGPSPDQLYGGRDHDHCDGGPGWGYSHDCEVGPRR